MDKLSCSALVIAFLLFLRFMTLFFKTQKNVTSFFFKVILTSFPFLKEMSIVGSFHDFGNRLLSIIFMTSYRNSIFRRKYRKFVFHTYRSSSKSSFQYWYFICQRVGFFMVASFAEHRFPPLFPMSSQPANPRFVQKSVPCLKLEPRICRAVLAAELKISF